MIGRIKSFFNMYAEAHDLLSDDEKQKALAVWGEAEEKIQKICMGGCMRALLEFQGACEVGKQTGDSNE